MENNETIAEGAAREAREEACAEVETNALIGVYNVARISQVQIFYRAKLVSDDIAVGPESAEVALFAWDDIPWDNLAFPSVYWALQHYRETKEGTVSSPSASPQTGPPRPASKLLPRATRTIEQ